MTWKEKFETEMHNSVKAGEQFTVLEDNLGIVLLFRIATNHGTFGWQHNVSDEQLLRYADVDVRNDVQRALADFREQYGG